MKYTTPDYELEVVETEDILEVSALYTDPDGDYKVLHDPKADGGYVEVQVPDVSILI